MSPIARAPSFAVIATGDARPAPGARERLEELEGEPGGEQRDDECDKRERAPQPDAPTRGTRTPLRARRRRCLERRPRGVALLASRHGLNLAGATARASPRAGAPPRASPRSRCARGRGGPARVVSRSSCSTTATASPSRRARRCANARASTGLGGVARRAARAAARRRRSRRRARRRAPRAPRCRPASPARGTGSSGVTTVSVGSQIATPQRALP